MSIRSTYLLGFLIVAALFSMSIYLQYFENFIPCPLCTLQRMAFIALGALFFLGFLLHKTFWTRMILNLTSTFFALIGMLLSARQVWLQHMPNPNAVECGVSLQYLVQAFPITQVMTKILVEGSAECTKRGWEFLHLNMAEWSLAWFTLLFLLVIYLFCKEFKWKNH